MFTIALAQCRRPEDGDVVRNARAFVRRAAGAGADLIVFPEAFMSRFDGSVERFCAASQPLDGAFPQAIDALANEFNLWVAYTISEHNPGGLPFNTAIITDASGAQRGAYRKTHLFDKQGERESAYTAAGDALMPPIKAPFATIGLAICYDLRFPEVTAAAAANGADLMLFPSAWVDGPDKVNQWKTLLRERAAENAIHVAGVSSVDPNRAGHSCVFAPDGTLLAEAGANEELLLCRCETTGEAAC
mgnify:CR=1 FL=1